MVSDTLQCVHIRDRWAAGAAAMILCILGTGAAPAHAAAEEADLSVSIASTRIPVGKDNKGLRLDLHNQGPAMVAEPFFRADLSGLDPARVEADMNAMPSCELAGAILTCPLNRLFGGERSFGVIFLTNHGTIGPAGSLSVEVGSSVTDPDLSDNTATADVAVVPSNVDFVSNVRDINDGHDHLGRPVPIPPGDAAGLVWTVLNVGDVTAEGVEFSITLPPHLSFVDHVDICDYEQQGGQEVAVCSDPAAVVPPLLGYSPHADPELGGIRVRVAQDAPSPAVLDGGMVNAVAIESGGASEPDADLGDNQASFSVHVGVPDPVDLAVSAAPAEGEVGGVARVAFQVTNHGPNLGRPFVTITAPPGTVVANDAAAEHASCGTPPEDDPSFENATELRCTLFSELATGESHDFAIAFTLRSAPTGDGLVAVHDFRNEDDNPANDTAPIVITTPGQGGGLPVTGARAGLLGAVGALAVATGAALFVIGRRRRIRFG
jgi:hypothetical protein